MNCNQWKASIAMLALLILVTGCGSDHGSHGHSHEPSGHGHGDAGRDDGAGGHAHGDHTGDRPVIVVTRWTERTELFMEHPVLVAGETNRAAIHVTDLADFSPVAEGQAVVTLARPGRGALDYRGTVSRPGIFGVDVRAPHPGTYSMTVRVDAVGLTDVHEIGEVTVHSPDSVPPAGGDDADGAITFLKEQQWVLDFGTTPAEVRSLRTGLTVPALVRPRTGGEVAVAAPVSGMIGRGLAVPGQGAAVRAGAVVARIVPRPPDLRDAAALRADVVEAEQAHSLALQERDRAERLVEARAVPARRLDEAAAALTASVARLDAARSRLARLESAGGTRVGAGPADTVAVEAPLSGIVSDVRVSGGSNVNENDVLFHVVDTSRVHVVGSVPEADAHLLPDVRSAELLVDGRPPVPLADPVTIGRVVDPIARTTEIRFALDNRRLQLPVGRAVSLRLFVGEAKAGTAIPESAVVEEDGRPVAFVQTGGESFESRALRLGPRSGGWVRVDDGIAPRDRVVHRGAYLVFLASRSTQIPSHGHVH